MQRLLSLALAAALTAGLAVSALAADGVAIKVSVKDDKGNPVKGAHVQVTGQGQPSTGSGGNTSGKTGEDGTVSLQNNPGGTPLKPGAYLVIVSFDKKDTSTVVFVDKGATAPIALTTSQINVPQTDLSSDLVKKATAAKEKCDKAAYDEAVNGLKAIIADGERRAKEFRDAAAALHAARDLPVKNAKEADKLVAQAAKLKASGANAPIDEALVKSLQDYSWLFHQARLEEHMVELTKKQLAAVPPLAACPKPGKELYVQGGCPAGQVPVETSALGGLIADLGLKGSGPDCVDRHSLDHDRDHDDHDKGRGHKD